MNGLNGNRRMIMAQQMVGGRNVNLIAMPSWLIRYALAVYVIALAVISFMYSNYSIPWYYMLSGVVGVSVFFLYSETLTKQTSVLRINKIKNFEKRIFIVSLLFRLTITLLLYSIFQSSYGDSFGFENGDATFYDEQAKSFAIAMRNTEFFTVWSQTAKYIDVSDLGYAAYVGFIYWLTGAVPAENLQFLGDVQATSALGILSVRILKCIWSSLTVLLIYRLAKRNFGEQTGRVAAIFVALWPNFWYYCGTHLKETEMVFLSVLFVEQSDQMLRSRQFTAWKVIPVLLIATAIFTVRTPLGLVALLSLVFSVVMSSSRVVNWGKRIIVGGLAIALIGVVAGNVISEKAESLLKVAQSHDQAKNMEWRAERSEGNSFAKYAGSAVFAPMIFTLPFPSMVRPYDGQDVQQFLNGGNFVKNIISCFTIFAMIMLLMSGSWREHLIPLSFMLGYLVVLAFSSFAQSERFHQPAMPFEFMFAAYGLSIVVTKKKYKRWFMYWCALMLVACVAWNWFKLKGRGLA